MAADQHACRAPWGTGIPESQSWPTLAQRQKRWTPKVRTGCLTCRRRRIKCDETKPVCNRCTTSANYCERYDVAHNTIAAAQPSLSGPKSPLRNANDRTSSTLLYFLDVTHPGYGLNSFRPNLLKQLPRRMGYSKVLDTTVATFTSLLETLHGPSPFQQPTHKSRQLYISSLKGLQRALATPDERYHPSTIFSASILAQCHVWMHQNSTIACGHGQGLTHLLNVVLVQKPKDPFVLGLCYAMLAEVLEQAVFNPNIQLFPWIQTLYSLPGPPLWKPSTYTATKPELPALNLAPLSMIPDLMRNPRENKQQIQSTYDYLIEVCLLVNKCVVANMECPYFDTWDFMRCNEIDGMCAGSAVVLNAFLRTWHPSNTVLLGQKDVLCAQVIALAERAMQERPLCAHHVPQALLASWCVADGHVKARLRQLLQDYRETYAMARLVYFVAFWPEAPAQIQDIPWFTLYDGGGHSDKGSQRDGPVKETNQTLTEYCCIL